MDSHSSLSQHEERFERWRRTVGFFSGPLAFLLVWTLPLAGLDPAAHRLAAIVALVVVWWVTEPIPIPATALIGAALMVVTGVATAQAAFSQFANPTVFLFIGSFILAEALAVHGLDLRLARWLLSVPWVRQSPFRVRFAFGALAAGLSMWISNTATAAMLLPVALGLLGGHLAGGGRHAGRGLLLTLAYSCSIGGVATPVGTPPNLIAIGMLGSLADFEVDFFRWMAVGVPVSLGMYAALTVLTRWLYPVRSDVEETRPRAASSQGEIGPWSAAQTVCLVAFGLAVVLWITPGIIAIVSGTSSPVYKLVSSRLDESVVAILAAGLLFVVPVNWRRREFALTWTHAARIDWGTILLFGGGLSLGHQMFQTGLAAKIGHGLVATSGATSLWTITSVMTIVAVLTTEIMSNTAATNMLVPVAIAVAKAAGVSAVPPAMGVAFGASLAYMLPISTPPNAIVYGTGRVPITEMIKCGVLLDALSVALVLVTLRLMCPLLGLV
jgi:solute carrier family 13 (sodium-dependent dicarboxylate transporter), member 2/3/5